ncbi:hypothetical protein Celaphus_00000420 [Cervus elaphus hippelaphus]|uniref:Uncharacterized protein n=1 Tax=Cervus elaphus hippelaphus TaxID=46360 RepID=A0A212D6U3_CEREH|nr:hypothetical protein Celaphus_00000420 [Cervus elaphus hippelaphus]
MGIPRPHPDPRAVMLKTGDPETMMPTQAKAARPAQWIHPGKGWEQIRDSLGSDAETWGADGSGRMWSALSCLPYPHPHFLPEDGGQVMTVFVQKPPSPASSRF